jgi:hypothetical protein
VNERVLHVRDWHAEPLRDGFGDAALYGAVRFAEEPLERGCYVTHE